jgi:polyisoprenoid-binding protein YceI
MRNLGGIVLTLALALAVPALADNRAAYVVDAKQSKLEIHVYREGFLKAFGHDHLISSTVLSGRVQVGEPTGSGSSVTFTVETKSLAVLDPGESQKDRKEVQETMLGETVLNAARFPQIQFVSSRVRSVVQKGEGSELQVEGTLSLHGVEKPVTLPVRIRVKEGTLAADGEVTLLQTDFGITPIRVGGGTVRVKDKVKVAFHVVAQKQGE